MLDQHDSDTLHRSGIVWRDVMVGDDLIRQYFRRSPTPPWEPQGETWELHCNVIYGGLACPAWVVEKGLDFNMYMGAITEVMKDAAPEQLENFHFNARLEVLNGLTGYRSTPLSPTIHRGYYIGELSYMDVPD